MTLRWRGRFVSNLVKEEAGDGLFEAAEHVLETANRTVPHDEGILQDSGLPSVDRDRLIAAVSYDTPYAVKQHEDLTLRHAEGRRGKWLERTVREEEQAIRDLVAGKIRAALRG